MWATIIVNETVFKEFMRRLGNPKISLCSLVIIPLGVINVAWYYNSVMNRAIVTLSIIFLITVFRSSAVVSSKNIGTKCSLIRYSVMTKYSRSFQLMNEKNRPIRLSSLSFAFSPITNV